MYGLIGVVIGAALAIMLTDALDKYRERKSEKEYLNAKREVEKEFTEAAKKVQPRIPVINPFQL